MKINAYTLMEVTIAMLLTAIVLTVCLTAFNIIGGYYTSFRKQAESKDIALMLNHVMEQDITRSNVIIKEGNGLKLIADSMQKHYVFGDSMIIRTVDDLKTDTFRCRLRTLAFSFENKPVEEPDTVDHVSFELLTDKKTIIPFEFNKHYSAYDLYR